MRRNLALILSLLLIPSVLSASESSFTDEQLTEISKLLQVEREKIRQEILLEVKEKGVKECERSEPLTQMEGQNESIEADKVSDPPTDAVASSNSELVVPATFNNKASTFDRSLNNNTSGFEVEASTASSRASIRFSREKSTPGALDEPLKFSSSTVTVSAPLDKKNDITNISTLDGFANSFKINYSLFKWSGIPTFIGESNPAIKRNDWAYGLNASLGYEKFNFYDSGSLTKEDSSKTPWGVGIFSGLIAAGKATVVSSGLKYQSTYESSAKKTICPPGTDVVPTECIAGNFGDPKNKKKTADLFRHSFPVYFWQVFRSTKGYWLQLTTHS